MIKRHICTQYNKKENYFLDVYDFSDYDPNDISISYNNFNGTLSFTNKDGDVIHRSYNDPSTPTTFSAECKGGLILLKAQTGKDSPQFTIPVKVLS